MNRNIWIGTIVIIALAAGAWWYFNQPNAPVAPATQVPTEQRQTAQTQNNTAPSATIFQSSLTVKAGQPTFSGTATGVSTIKVEIWKPDPAAASGFVWWTGMVVPVVNGTWSASVAQGSDATTLLTGAYKIDLLDWDNSGADPVRLAQNTLTVSPETQPITVQNQNGQMTATPTASNTWQFSFGGAFAEQQQTYVLDFGDGAQVSVQCQTMAADGQPVCNQLAALTHTYTKAGAYQVKLLETFVGVGPGNEQTTALLALQVSN